MSKDFADGVRSLEKGPLPFTTDAALRNLAFQGYGKIVRCTVGPGLSDIALFE